MQYDNPWEDRTKKRHKNVKAVKPEPKIIKPKEKTTDEINKQNWEFIEGLAEKAFPELSVKTRKNVEKTFGKECIENLLTQTNLVKEDILESTFLPDKKTRILLSYIVMLQDQIN